MKTRHLLKGRALSAALFALLLSVVGATNGYAQDIVDYDHGLGYTINEDGNTVTVTHLIWSNCIEWNEECYIDIPSTVSDVENNIYTVSAIGEGAFNVLGVVSVTIPNTVTTIGNAAFANCSNLVSLNIPESLSSIGEMAFYNCSGLTSINLPNTLTEIGGGAFSGCTGLSGDLVIPNSVTSIGVDAFYNCGGFETIVVEEGNDVYDSRYNCNAIINSQTNELLWGCKNTIVPSSVTTIGDGAFSNCADLTSISLPEQLTSIGNYAFYGCSGLASINIPSSVTSIGNGAFCECSGLISVTIPSMVSVINEFTFTGCSGLASVAIPNSVMSIEYYAFGGCSALTSAEIPNSVFSIADYAFCYCSNLVSVAIPNSVNSIGKYAFMDCISLSSIIVPNSIGIIEEGTFSGCSDLTTVILPNTLGSINDYAFYGCSNIISIISLAETPPSFGDNAFESSNPNAIVNVPCGFEDDYVAISWGGFGDFYGICGGAVTVIVDPIEYGSVSGGGLFGANQTCTLTAIPNSGYAFSNWTMDGQMVSNNDEYTFYVTGDMSLVAHFVPDGNIDFADSNVKSICVTHWDTNRDGELSYAEAAAVHSLGSAFSRNGEITTFEELQFFTGLSSIGYNAFSNCNGLTSIVLPNSITSIGEYAFYGCSGLTSMSTIPNTVNSIGQWAFYNCSSLTGTFVIPNSVISIGKSVFNGCSGIASLTIGNSVVSIGEEAFIGCTGLNSVYYTGNTYQWCRLFFGSNPWTNPLCYAHNLYIDNELVTDLIIPEDITRIKEFAFHGASCLTSLTISNSVTSIGQWAFMGCSGLTTMNVYAETPPALASTNNTSVFGNVNKSIPVYIPYGTTSAYQTAPGWSEFTNFIEMEAVNHFIPQGAAYSETMALYSVIQIDGVEQYSNTLEVGVFCGDECRGSAIASEFSLTHRYLAILNVFGENGHELTFKLYDHSTGQELELNSPAALTFDIDGYGNPIDPYVLNFTSTKVIAASLDPEEAGTVVGAGEYALGETCTLTATANEGFQFKNWTLNGEVVSTEPSYSFTVAEDAAYVAHFHYVHTQALAAGWNWWSTYVEQEGIDGLEMLENSLGGAGVRIQGRDGFVDHFEYQGTSYWYGNLESIENGYMYKVRTNAECEAVMVSDLVSPTDHPVTISEGWNWFGFPCNQSQSLDEAMSGFVPEANDVVKGRNGASTFVSYGSSNMWYGTLHTLEPGQGYMYKSNSSTPKELTFLARRGGEVGEDVREGGFFTPNAADFASNMLVTAVIEMDGEELRSDEYELAAFVGDECRGSVKLMYVEALDRYVAFLLVYGDMQEDMDFALANGNDVVWSDNRLTYTVDGIEGTPTDPVILHFGTLGIDDNQRELVKVFPNPSNGIFNIEGNGSRKVEVLDACGQIVFSKETEDDCVQIDLSAKANGLYLLRVVSNNGVTTNRLIKK